MATLTQRVERLEERVDDIFLLVCGLVLIAPRLPDRKALRPVADAFHRFVEDPSSENRRQVLEAITAAVAEGPPAE